MSRPRKVRTTRHSPVCVRLTDEHRVIIAQAHRGISDAQRATLLRALAPLWTRRDVATALNRRDVGAIYAVLNRELGIPQRQLGMLTGQSQSEIAEILAGRQVLTYDLLLRVATNLGIPLWRMGLSAEPPARARRRANRRNPVKAP